MALTDKQKEERENKLGSSDAATVTGLSKYSGPLELFYKFTGALPRYDDIEKMHQKIGSRLEPVIGELVAEELNIKIRRMPSRVHPVHDFMMAHADFEIVSNPKGPGLLEIKNRSGERPWESVPDDITIQVQHQLAVTGRKWATVGALFQYGQIKSYEVEYDKELADYLIEIELRFMNCVRSGIAPNHTWTAENIGILKKLYPADSGKVIALPVQQALNIEGYLAAKKELEAIEERKALYEGLIKEAMTDAAEATAPGYKVTWKSTKAGQKFNEEKFKEEHPDLWQSYQKLTPGYRRFLVKPSKELA